MGEWKTDSPLANLVAHAILGAVVAELQGNSGVVGGASAVSGELAAPIIPKALYGDRKIKDLTEDEKENLSALTQLAIGLTIASMGGDSSDIVAGVNSSKNAVENNMLAQAAVITWRVLRPSAIGQTVTITAVDVLVGRGLSIAEATAFLNSLTLEQRQLIKLALTDPMGDSNFENAVQKTYESYYNEYFKKKSSNKNTDTDNALTGSTSSTTSGGASLPPDDDDDKDKSKNDSSNNGDKKGVGGNGDASELPNLDGMSPDDARKLLEKYGFDPKSTSASSWQKFKGKDGSTVQINWQNGRIVRTAAPKYGADGSKINGGKDWMQIVMKFREICFMIRTQQK